MTLRHSARWPYRQADPRWAKEKMWVTKTMREVHKTLNHATQAELDEFEFGDSIKSDGCLLTCLAMTLRLLARGGSRWTPGSLNREAKERLYYSDAGVSNVPLYADLVADVTGGRVQLCVQEQYFAGEEVQPARFVSQCTLIRGYRNLPAARRSDFAVMLKMGTHDDTFASHYVLIDPDRPGLPDDDDVAILDPDQPKRDRVKPWYLSDSYKRIAHDSDIRREWTEQGILWEQNQISAVWVFARGYGNQVCPAKDLLSSVSDY